MNQKVLRGAVNESLDNKRLKYDERMRKDDTFLRREIVETRINHTESN